MREVLSTAARVISFIRESDFSRASVSSDDIQRMSLMRLFIIMPMSADSMSSISVMRPSASLMSMGIPRDSASAFMAIRLLLLFASFLNTVPASDVRDSDVSVHPIREKG